MKTAASAHFMKLNNYIDFTELLLSDLIIVELVVIYRFEGFPPCPRISPSGFLQCVY